MLRKTFLCLFCVASTLVSAGSAQTPPVAIPTPPNLSRPVLRLADPNDTVEALDDNYVLTLALKEKDTEAWTLGLVVATRSFNNSAAQPNMTFNGKLLPQENGTFLVDYQLARNVAVTTNGNTEYRSAASKSSVRLRLGEPVQIIKDGNQVFTLKLERYKP